MMEIELANLISKIQSAQAERQTTEVKRARNAAPGKLYDAADKSILYYITYKWRFPIAVKPAL